ncbi:unnamed protein product [Owenia fusiformis]|uniref:Uncharacterized protein n=1 Tax=Owenia fusiformis TaxID=6347 RepID=A0A8J1U539_OWEFU|nr:unnamed protein product [Owenia fusiformis]
MVPSALGNFGLSFPVTSFDDTPGTPIITITEDNTLPADEEDFVKYFGLEKHTEEEGSKNGLLNCVCTVNFPAQSLLLSGHVYVDMSLLECHLSLLCCRQIKLNIRGRYICISLI